MLRHVELNLDGGGAAEGIGTTCQLLSSNIPVGLVTSKGQISRVTGMTKRLSSLCVVVEEGSREGESREQRTGGSSGFRLFFFQRFHPREADRVRIGLDHHVFTMEGGVG